MDTQLHLKHSDDIALGVSSAFVGEPREGVDAQIDVKPVGCCRHFSGLSALLNSPCIQQDLRKQIGGINHSIAIQLAVIGSLLRTHAGVQFKNLPAKFGDHRELA